MNIEIEKFREIKKQREELYKNLGKIYCPYLNIDVHFNNKGFDHLLFKSWNKTRNIKEQYIRLKLLPLAVAVIRKSHTLQEYDERKMFVKQKVHSRWEKILRTVEYYVFTAVIKDKDVRIKVIIKQVENSVPIFYSIYPSWKIKNTIQGVNKKVFYFGNLEED
jgi:hypothetical protein